MKGAAKRATKRTGARLPARAAKPAARAAKPVARTNEIDAYLAKLPPRVRTALQRLRNTIHAAAPRAVEGESYGMPAFRLGRPLVAFAAFRAHCSFFPMSARVIEDHARELAGFQTSKGTIRFTLERPLPASLVRKLVRARVAEIAAAEEARAPRKRARRG